MRIVKDMISNNELENLYSYFELPFAVKDILEKNGQMSADEEYAMHEIICDMQPDSALIAIALCARNLAQHIKSSRGDKLRSFSAFTIGEYAPAWLSNANQEKLSDESYRDLLREVPEDLSMMSSLLTACSSSFHDKNNNIAKICNILAIQAASHSDIAIAYLDALDQSMDIKNNNKIDVSEEKSKEFVAHI